MVQQCKAFTKLLFSVIVLATMLSCSLLATHKGSSKSATPPPR